MEWIGNVELALKGINSSCRFEFDNTLTYKESEQAEVKTRTVDNILKLYQNGLIDKEKAQEIAGGIISAI